MKDIKKCIDLTGQRYGKLTVLSLVETDTRKTYWLCKCDCGEMIKVRSDCLRNGTTKTCKCERNARFVGNTYQRKHNMEKTRVYHIWQGVKRRCYNPKDKRYADYGGRGITVCEEWLDEKIGSTNFINWALANGYSDDLTIDRKDNDGNYTPDNCRWVTMKEQSNNRRSNIIIEYEDKEYTLMQLCEMLNLPFKTIAARYDNGDRNDRLFRPIGEDRQNKRGEDNKKAKITEETARNIKNDLKTNLSQVEIARKYNVSKYIVFDIKRGKTWDWL